MSAHGDPILHRFPGLGFKRVSGRALHRSGPGPVGPDRLFLTTSGPDRTGPVQPMEHSKNYLLRIPVPLARILKDGILYHKRSWLNSSISVPFYAHATLKHFNAYCHGIMMRASHVFSMRILCLKMRTNVLPFSWSVIFFITNKNVSLAIVR